MEVVAVIPLRASSDCTSDGRPKHMLAGRPLWEHTIEQAATAAGISRIVVAYDDPVLEILLASWSGRVEFWKRPRELSGNNVNTIEVVAAVARDFARQGRHADYFLLLEITHPLRPRTLIDQVIGIAVDHPAHTVFTARAVHYNIWQPTADGMRRLDTEHETTKVYEEMVGIGSLFSPRHLLSDNPFGTEIDVVPIDRFWAALDVRDNEILTVAENYLKSIKGGK